VPDAVLLHLSLPLTAFLDPAVYRLWGPAVAPLLPSPRRLPDVARPALARRVPRHDEGHRRLPGICQRQAEEPERELGLHLVPK
jgi:hypothetical protein